VFFIVAMLPGERTGTGLKIVANFVATDRRERMDGDARLALTVVLNHDDGVQSLREEIERLENRVPKNRYLRAVLSVIEAEKKAAENQEIIPGQRQRTCGRVDPAKIKTYYQAETRATDDEWSRIPRSAKLAIVPCLTAFGYHVLTDPITASIFVSWDMSQYGQDEMRDFCRRAAVVYGEDGMPPPVLSLALL